MGVTGVLDLLQVPYTGGGPGELYLQEDKALSKKLLAYEQVLYPDYARVRSASRFRNGGQPADAAVRQAGADGRLARDRREVAGPQHPGADGAGRRIIHKTFGDAALAEEYIEGREFYVGVLGNQDPLAFPPDRDGFLRPARRQRAVHGQQGQVRRDQRPRIQGHKAVIAKLDPELKARLQKMALDAYRALRVRDYGRIDMRLTDSGEIYVIEVNASCYLEEESEFAMAAAADGIDYAELINRIPDLAMERWKHRTQAKKKRKRAAAQGRGEVGQGGPS